MHAITVEALSTVRVVLVVNRFPVTSESFILRTVEMIVDHLGATVTIIAISGYDADKLVEFAPNFLPYLVSGKVRICCGPFATPLQALKAILSALLRFPVATCRTTFGLAGPILKSGVRAKYAIKGAYLAKRLSSLVQSGEVIVHPQFLSLGVSCAVACALLDAKTIQGRWGTACHIRGSDISRAGVISDREIAYLNEERRIPCRFLASSDSLRRMAVARGVDKASISTLYSPLSTQTLPWPWTGRTCPRGGRQLIQVGRLVEKKGARMSLQALAKLGDTGTHLEFVGDGPEASSLKRLAGTLGIAHRVSFPGALPQHQTLERIRSADVLLVPSLTGSNGDCEGIPNVIKEAMALGTLVVASDHGGAPEIVEDGVNGYLFGEGDQEAFVATLERALSSPDDWDRLLQAAREVVVSRFDSRHIARGLEACYLKILSRASRATDSS